MFFFQFVRTAAIDSSLAVAVAVSFGAVGMKMKIEEGEN